ncbi:MAG: T9SS type A sorting domain-containing protein [Lewinellaceae bacterium]|nr:T9SS type A sorting domain-containing protein [Lewinellaceae bacterium]
MPCTATVSVEAGPEMGREVVKVYPNPADEQVTFTWPESVGSVQRLRLFNTLGQVVKDKWSAGDSQAYTLSLSDLMTGVYFWELTGEGGNYTVAGKVVRR